MLSKIKIRKRFKTNLSVIRFVSRLPGVTDRDSQNDRNIPALPANSKVVICGGGIMGAAVAYHLAEKGWGNETTIIEKVHFTQLWVSYI